MRHLSVIGFIFLIVSHTGFAAEGAPFVPQMPQPLLDKISFQVSAKQWVTTQTALLTVTINMTLNSADVLKARTDIMERLNKIAQGDWHLVDFVRSQDSSGLEKLYVRAQVRLKQEGLTDIYKNAKTVSLPGAQYEISSVDFKPSLSEIQDALTKIRQQLYQQVNDELMRINKFYPAQNYSVSNLTFVEENNYPQPRAYQAKEMNTVLLSTQAGASPALTVSNELILTANVEVSSNRKP